MEATGVVADAAVEGVVAADVVGATVVQSSAVVWGGTHERNVCVDS